MRVKMVYADKRLVMRHGKSFCSVSNRPEATRPARPDGRSYGSEIFRLHICFFQRLIYHQNHGIKVFSGCNFRYNPAELLMCLYLRRNNVRNHGSAVFYDCASSFVAAGLQSQYIYILFAVRPDKKRFFLLKGVLNSFNIFLPFCFPELYFTPNLTKLKF